jgi:type I restriction enzyme M protein
MVAPNGLLFGDGVAARIKQRLLEECNVHTIVRLPEGVFAPYTPIPTNLLFFEKTGRTRDIWFYEMRPPEGQKRYSKTRPIRFEEFADCQAWWGGPSRQGREETELAWRVPIGDIESDGWNLDRRNPSRANDLEHRAPAELLDDLIAGEREILTLLEELQSELNSAS